MQLQTKKILAGKLFDSFTGDLLENRLIVVSPESGLILEIKEFEDSARGLVAAGVDLNTKDTIDLRDRTVLPGFVDAHVHCKCRNLGAYTVGNSVPINSGETHALTPVFLHQYSETTWEDQVTRESLAERTVRATAHARRTLLAGFTSVR